ncbi:hypothetical protein [Pedobacter nyackensis]|uniref:HEAT repeat-containing protein n=1 Tax=Pedobacter nyackensis TaxID=475255 RepID=A0A1W2EHA5_9SPHI|nr:hypothetical protein [Pedobacter nyackensis]SMD08538.1 hypothetical protein SAMN04488101_11237 [Pedobacter nyackensis]
MNDLKTYLEAVRENRVDELEGKIGLHMYDEVDREEYQHYIPLLCKYIQSEKDYVSLNDAYEALSRILLPDTNLEPLKDVVRGGGKQARDWAFRIFGTIDNTENEHFLLEVLSRTEDKEEIFTICVALTKIGSIRCFPILLARLSSNRYLDEVIYDTLKEVAEKLKMLPEACEELMNPSFWKTTWSGSGKEFVEFMSGIPIENINLYDMDQLAEIYIEEMEVDIFPHKSFKDLRIFYSKGGILEDKIEASLEKLHKLIEQLQSMIAMDEVLEETGVSVSKGTLSEDLLAELRSTYFTTRLRRRIKFEDDDY